MRGLTFLLTTVLATTATSQSTTPPPANTLPCSPLELISARGTYEPQSGSLGMAPVISRLQRRFPRSTLYNVQYPATNDYAVSSAKGAADLQRHLLAQSDKCPDQNYVLFGYSQGAMVLTQTYGAITNGTLGATTMERVKAAVMFGNPHYDPQSPASFGSAKGIGTKGPGVPKEWVEKSRDYCNVGDIVCDPTGDSWLIHGQYAYSKEATQAYQFVVQKVSA
ncbi:hypothetical protein HK104_002473 [Borealophlyctis nickersoniae]|nr:hypothetical protein HK104_002473 [Borealophlyctis nickersoniae]